MVEGKQDKRTEGKRFAYPGGWKRAGLNTAYGFSMGTANVIPGVSGGTMALIHGIYEELVEAIRSANWEFIKTFVTLKWRRAFNVLRWPFLVPLGVGVMLAVVTLAKVIPYLLEHHRAPICAFFVGLILASALVIGRQVGRWSAAAILTGLAAAAGSYILVGVLPVRTPNAAWFVFICGVVAIMAMLLPGISGAFMLLILGKYKYILGAVEGLVYRGNLEAILPLGIFGLGCVTGLAALARLLSYLLKQFRDPTMAALGGLMLGSLRKLWPWRETVRWTRVGSKDLPLEEANRFPEAFDLSVGLAIALLTAGAALVVLLEYLARKQEPEKRTDDNRHSETTGA